MTDDSRHRILEALQARIYRSLTRSAAMACLPGRSSQRLDWTDLACFDGGDPRVALDCLLGAEARAMFSYKVETIALPTAEEKSGASEEQLAQYALLEERAKEQQTKDRQFMRLSKLVEEARIYEQDTGSYTLFLGYPLLSLPRTGQHSRILAPLAFIPVTLELQGLHRRKIVVECLEEGENRVIANPALEAWLAHGQGLRLEGLKLQDNEIEDPVLELRDLTRQIAEAYDLQEAPDPGVAPLQKLGTVDSLPRTPAVVPAAVLGLFCLDYQCTLADLEELDGAEEVPPTVAPFLSLDADLMESDAELKGPEESDLPKEPWGLDDQMILEADPCQRLAVTRARKSRAIVVHGPPGTGKSQTIANIISDNLVRGQRVLLVCEKRTALDVVKNRLDHLGLAKLSAVIHDAARDRVALYKDVRDQLSNLADCPIPSDPKADLTRVGEEIQRLREDLQQFLGALHQRTWTGEELSFSDLVGEWLEARMVGGIGAGYPQQGSGEEVEDLSPDALAALGGLSLSRLKAREGEVMELMERAERVGYASHPWVGETEICLGEYRKDFERKVAEGLDQALILANQLFAEHPTVVQCRDLLGSARGWVGKLEKLAEFLMDFRSELEQPGCSVDALILQGDAGFLGSCMEQWPGLKRLADGVVSVPENRDLMEILLEPEWTTKRLAEAQADMETYLQTATGFFGFLRFGTRKRAQEILRDFGLALSPEAADRVRASLRVRRNQLSLSAGLSGVLGVEVPLPRIHGEQALMGLVQRVSRLLDLRKRARDFSARLDRAMGLSFGDQARSMALFQALRQSELYGQRFREFQNHLKSLQVFGESALQRIYEMIDDEPGALVSWLRELARSLPSLELVLRVEQGVKALGPELQPAMQQLLRMSSSSGTRWMKLKEAVLRQKIEALLQAQPILSRLDTQALAFRFDRLPQLQAQYRRLIVEEIQRLWQTKQKKGLLASTGTQLNRQGSELRNRLMIRGVRATRLRQVFSLGAELPYPDPIFDLKPVWMASPETVAQVFPLKPLFDVVIFDEASQCRLEHGLPVVARGQRVVIAGDTRQLPPTRFFESGASNRDIDDGEDNLFVQQQTEIEDMLAGALNTRIDQVYLDVHYRSRASELIEFSNRHFYGSRLQLLPPAPGMVGRSRAATILHQVDGAYEGRRNRAEAAYVVERVRYYLQQDSPPSLGIVSFNLDQKELIQEQLQGAADEDEDFRSRLEQARNRQGAGFFEGLFVKNLENVQGDERDVILISTTFGRDSQGRFFRRFGPLGQMGGERRLNVLITRARMAIEVITSIPPEIYRQTAPLSSGVKPNGSWYFLAYLQYLDSLRWRTDQENSRAAGGASGAGGNRPPVVEAVIRHFERRSPGRFSAPLGSEGLRLDAGVLRLNEDGEAQLQGALLVDGPRYHRAPDLLEWDLFRSEVFKHQGWKIHRIWTSELFRDPEGWQVEGTEPGLG